MWPPLSRTTPPRWPRLSGPRKPCAGCAWRREPKGSSPPELRLSHARNSADNVAKRLNSRYRPGVRSRDWVTMCRHRVGVIDALLTIHG